MWEVTGFWWYVKFIYLTLFTHEYVYMSQSDVPWAAWEGDRGCLSVLSIFQTFQQIVVMNHQELVVIDPMGNETMYDRKLLRNWR